MNIYIDAGFYVGMALQKYIDQGVIDKSWTIYAFEPNPDLQVKQRIADFFGDYTIQLIEKPVWTADSEVVFEVGIGGRNDSASIQGTASHAAFKEVLVPAVDFSKFVADLPEAYILCSMDVEGAEFKVLEKMLADNTIDRINLLDIEFHHRLLQGYTDQDARALIEQIEARGVKVTLKDNLI